MELETFRWNGMGRIQDLRIRGLHMDNSSLYEPLYEIATWINSIENGSLGKPAKKRMIETETVERKVRLATMWCELTPPKFGYKSYVKWARHILNDYFSDTF